MPPELVGALCSRASRAVGDLREVFLKEFIKPVLNPIRDSNDSDEAWGEREKHSESLLALIEFTNHHGAERIFSNPRARAFYVRWLAEFGDDSIAQMAGTHLVFACLSQVAIKYLEDQRIGLAPIEKSTRYVNYGVPVNGRYLYYTDVTLADPDILNEYESAMERCFQTYNDLIPRMSVWLKSKFPEEKTSVVEKKAFDILRGLLPTSTISQVAFFGNGQAFEHMINRSMAHPLHEIRWAAEEALRELSKVTPSFFRRITDGKKRDAITGYQKNLVGKGGRVKQFTSGIIDTEEKPSGKSKVTLVDYDRDGENKVIAAMLYSSPDNHHSWEDVLWKVQGMKREEKLAVIGAYLGDRNARWQKVGRAFENTYVRFEILTNIGAWRDLHRHRMFTQMRQSFTCRHGYEIPPEVIKAGLETEYREAIVGVEESNRKIASENPEVAQYSVNLAHGIRFMIYSNLRALFWMLELRTIPEGHPDYRHVCQEMWRKLQGIYPLIAEQMLVNMGEYDFARRGQEERVQRKTSQPT